MLNKDNIGYAFELKLLVSGIVIGIVLVALLIGVYHYSSNPGFCSLCHSMENVHGKWLESTHKRFDCIECHLPAGNQATRFVYKSRAGVNDLVHETIRDYPAGIVLSAEGRDIASSNCFRCHFATVENTPMARGSQSCLSCHRGLVHGRNVIGEGGVRIEKGG